MHWLAMSLIGKIAGYLLLPYNNNNRSTRAIAGPCAKKASFIDLNGEIFMLLKYICMKMVV